MGPLTFGGAPLYFKCLRCNERVLVVESCWYCHGELCAPCWEAFGHCGHPEAEAENERARKVRQP